MDQSVALCERERERVSDTRDTCMHSHRSRVSRHTAVAEEVANVLDEGARANVAPRLGREDGKDDLALQLREIDLGERLDGTEQGHETRGVGVGAERQVMEEGRRIEGGDSHDDAALRVDGLERVPDVLAAEWLAQSCESERASECQAS